MSERGIEMARGREIRDLDRLVSRYGRDGEGWTKRTSSSYRFRGMSKRMETHWYEHDSGLRVEFKHNYGGF
jgi:hypothetical protein